MAPPVCGPVVSPEWLKNRKSVATIHECKIPDPKLCNTKEGTEEYNKAVNKSEELIKYAKHVDSYMISQKTERQYLKQNGVGG